MNKKELVDFEKLLYEKTINGEIVWETYEVFCYKTEIKGITIIIGFGQYEAFLRIKQYYYLKLFEKKYYVSGKIYEFLFKKEIEEKERIRRKTELKAIEIVKSSFK